MLKIRRIARITNVILTVLSYRKDSSLSLFTIKDRLP
nr:MAG TPA: hypothetical protein [Caudoviricetes sp.]